MITTIARNELRLLIRDGRVRTLAVALAVLIGLAAAIAAQRQAAERRAHQLAVATMRAQWVDQGPRNPHGAAHWSIYALRPTAPLEALAPGVLPYAGSMVWLEAHRQNLAIGRSADDAPTSERLGVLSPALILEVLAPLLVIVAGFATLAGEREAGTARMLIATGLPMKKLIAGKALGLGLVLVAWLVPALTLVVVAMAIIDPGPWAGRAALLGGAQLVYLTGWLALTVAASAWCPTARGALATLLLLWSLVVLVMPRVVGELSRAAQPVPSATEFEQDMARAKGYGLDARSAYQQRVDALERAMLLEHGAEKREELPFNFDAVEMQADEVFNDVVHDRAHGGLHDRFDADARARARLGFVVPSLAIAAISQGAAGTDVHHQRRFIGDAERYRRALVAAMNHDMEVNSRSGDWDYAAGRALWETVPPLRLPVADVVTVVREQSGAIAALLGWLGLSTLLALLASRRLVRRGLP